MQSKSTEVTMPCNLVRPDQVTIAINAPLQPEKTNVLDLNRAALRQFFVQMGEKAFRAEQVMQWIYQMGCDNFQSMTNLNQVLRNKLSQVAVIQAPEIVLEQCASDGTIKWALAVGEQQVETVYIPERDRGTLCVSSQVGCALACTFCSTAQQGFNRNLRVSEIIGQVWRALQRLRTLTVTHRRPITNIVMMGMGEPLLNLTHVVPALELMLDDWAFGLSKRRVTLSTSGVVPALDKLGDLIDVALAISLHAPDDVLRDQLVPINRKYNIATLLASVRRYLAKSKANHGRVTIEYVMLNHVNDSLEQAQALAVCLKDIPCKINLIPWNRFLDAPYQCSPRTRIEQFAQYLIKQGFTVTVRKTRGEDIDAACGQLVGEVIDRTKRQLKIAPIGELIACQNINH